MNEGLIRFGVFASVLIIFIALEALFPRRNRNLPRRARWVTNLGFAIINGLAVRLLGPLIAIGVTAWAVQNNIGLFNKAGWPLWLEITAAFILLDFAIYLATYCDPQNPCSLATA